MKKIILIALTIIFLLGGIVLFNNYENTKKLEAKEQAFIELMKSTVEYYHSAEGRYPRDLGELDKFSASSNIIDKEAYRLARNSLKELHYYIRESDKQAYKIEYTSLVNGNKISIENDYINNLQKVD